ncbi:DUF2971 domain-containing protein [Candidatus Poribacteria bacterium]|nr:DUF2971 domain-containing protein [Candidatus Poribacteria bacterium]
MVFYKYVSAERVDILQNRLIRFTQPNALNDPFEARPNFYALATEEGFASAFADTIRQEFRMWEKCRKDTQTSLDQQAFANKVERNPNYAKQLHNRVGQPDLRTYARERTYELCNYVGILSLSETWDNLLMWAHYAEEHAGFVLMLDGSHNFFEGNVSFLGMTKPEPVQYRSERPHTTIQEVIWEEIFLVKGSDWKYEKEWRYLKYLNDADERHEKSNTHSVELFRLPPKCIRGVILGCYRSKELENKVVALQRDDPQLGHLQILQARASTTRYRLRREEIET